MVGELFVGCERWKYGDVVEGCTVEGGVAEGVNAEEAIPSAME